MLQIGIYTQKHNVYFVKSEDINWSKIPQFSACQILNVMEYFTKYKDENVLQIILHFNQLKNVGVAIFLEDKIKALSRTLKTNMLAYDGPPIHFSNLFIPHMKRGIFSFHQFIHPEKEKKVRCKNYPFEGFSSFGDCDKKYLYDKFLNVYKIMPFWIAKDSSHTTNIRWVGFYARHCETVSI